MEMLIEFTVIGFLIIGFFVALLLSLLILTEVEKLKKLSKISKICLLIVGALFNWFTVVSLGLFVFCFGIYLSFKDLFCTVFK